MGGAEKFHAVIMGGVFAHVQLQSEASVVFGLQTIVGQPSPLHMGHFTFVGGGRLSSEAGG
jgi:hypothetical protein